MHDRHHRNGGPRIPTTRSTGGVATVLAGIVVLLFMAPVMAALVGLAVRAFRAAAGL